MIKKVVLSAMQNHFFYDLFQPFFRFRLIQHKAVSNCSALQSSGIRIGIK